MVGTSYISGHLKPVLLGKSLFELLRVLEKNQDCLIKEEERMEDRRNINNSNNTRKEKKSEKG